MPEDPDEIFKFQVELVDAEEVTPETHKRSKIDQSPAPLPSEWEGAAVEERAEAEPVEPPPAKPREALSGGPTREALAAHPEREALPPAPVDAGEPSADAEPPAGAEHPAERPKPPVSARPEIQPVSSLVQTKSDSTDDQPPRPQRKKRKPLFSRSEKRKPERDPEREAAPADESSTPARAPFEMPPREETAPAETGAPPLAGEPSLWKRIWAKLNSDIGKSEKKAKTPDVALAEAERGSPPVAVAPPEVAPPEVASPPPPVAEPEVAPPAVEREPEPVAAAASEESAQPSLWKRIWAKLNSDIGKSEKKEKTLDASPSAVVAPAEEAAPTAAADVTPSPAVDAAPPIEKAPVVDVAPSEEGRAAPPEEAPVVADVAPVEEVPAAPSAEKAASVFTPEPEAPVAAETETEPREKSSLWARIKGALSKEIGSKSSPESAPAEDQAPSPLPDLSAAPPGAAEDAPEAPKLVVSEESEVIQIARADESDMSEREKRREERRRKREEEKAKAEERREKKLALKQRLQSLNQSTDRWNTRRKEEREIKKREKAKENKEKEVLKKEQAEQKAQEKAKAKAEKNPGLRERIAERRRRKSAEKARKIGKDIVGLKIGAASLRAVHLQEDQPIRVYEYPLPEGVIENGILEEPDELTTALRDMWKASELTSKKVNFSLNNRLITVRTIPHLQIDDEQLDQALAYMASIVIAPMDPEQSIIDYDKLSRTGDGQDIQMAAADKKMVQSYVKAIEKAGLSAVSCEIGALAGSRAMVVPRAPGQAHLVVDIGAELTAVTAVSGPDLFFYHVVELGGNDFTRAISKALGVSFSEAERYKKSTSMSDQDPRVSAAVTRVADQLAQELQQTKEYFQEDTKRGGRPVISWSLIGGGARFEGLSDHLGLYTHIGELVQIDPWPGLEGAPDLELTTDVLGLAKSHTMSLIPDASPGSFSISSPFRRKAKISLSEADKRAKRLSKSRAPKKEINFKLYGILAAMAILVGSYFMANKLSPEEVPQSAATAGAPVGSTVITYDDPNATRVAELLGNSLDLTAFSKLADLFKSSEVFVQSATIQKNKIQITGVGPNMEAIRGLSKKISQEIPSADVQLKPGALNTNGQGFSLSITAPNTPEGD